MAKLEYSNMFLLLCEYVAILTIIFLYVLYNIQMFSSLKSPNMFVFRREHLIEIRRSAHELSQNAGNFF